MNINKFYDIHFHAMDLSHANLTAFADRFINNESVVKKFLKKVIPVWSKLIVSILMPLIGPFVPYSFLSRKVTKIISGQTKVRNLLSFMETSVLYDFLIVEYFLKHGKENKDIIVTDKNEFTINDQKYNKIVLCPLIMDFGYPNINNRDYFYNIPPQKPVTSQIRDLFSAIRTYYTKKLTIDDNSKVVKFTISNKEFDKENELFEIYPFMGINTVNYDIDKIKKMIDKYFGDFYGNDTKEERYMKLHKAMGEFNGNLEDEEQCKNIFAGIKLYPPLGFDPWPNDPEEKAKVEYIYEKCIEKRIPIIAHCSNGGFVASHDYHKYTNPNTKWNEVLNNEKYSKLKIDFAHLGEDDETWTKKILELASNPEHNVYADFSSNADNPDYYTRLKKQLIYHNEAEGKIMYGSDFMINLLKVNSLNEYMQFFIKTQELTPLQKVKFANRNPENFLFGD